MRALGALAVAASLVLTAACSGDEDEGPDVGPAPEVVADAVAAFSDDNTGRFTFQIGDDSDALVSTSGAYVVDARQVEWQMTLSNGERSVITDHVRLADRAWLRSARDGSAPEGCWQPSTARRAAERTSTEFEPPADSVGTYPLLPHAAVVTTVEATEWSSAGSVAEGTADLYTVSATLGEVVGELDLSPESLDARIGVSLLLDDGQMLAWRTDVVAVLEALADAGVTLTDDMVELVDTGADIQVASAFHDLGADVDIERPARRDLCRGN